MQRTKLRNKFLKDPSAENWQTIKPFLSEKTKSREKITLIENENLVSDNAEVADCLNNFCLILLKVLKYLSMK